MNSNNKDKIRAESNKVKDMKTIGNLKENIKKMRRVLMLSQEEFSDMLGLHRSYLSDIERGIRNPSISVIIDIAKILNISVSIFLKANVEIQKDADGNIVFITENEENLVANGLNISKEGTGSIENSRYMGKNKSKYFTGESIEELMQYKMKEHRLRLGYTQQEVSNLAGLNRGYYSKLENGKCMPTVCLLEKISEAFECEVWDLL